MCILRLLNIVLLLLSVQMMYGQTADSLIVSDLRKAGVSFSHNNSIVLFTSGQEKYDEMFATIRQARESIHLEYFNFRNDSIASALFDILAEKAKEGVEVRALYDAFGNMSNNRPLKNRHVEAIRARGIELYEFDPIGFPWINHVFSRDHRKIVVIDGKVAFTGGMNVADYYIHGTEVVGDWHDMHCRIDGDEVNTLQKIFLSVWNKTTGQNVHGAKYYRGIHSAIKGTIDASRDAYIEGVKRDTTATAYKKMVGIINREPHRTNKIMRQFYISCFDRAQDSVRLINPYMSLTHSVKKAIKRCLKRGVKVQVMMSAVSDIPMEPDASFYNLHWMMKRGAEVYIYEGGFHHTKIIMVDGRVSTVGSCNLDARSLNWDYEENAVIVDKNTTGELDRHFDAQKKHSFRLTPERWNQWRTRWQKTYGWLSKWLSPWL
ncbi:MAG: phosphatidylserine/phosphatidylglycerophosphate/cardiolipin synthase family protein [Prevotella sp.]|nr:phosphatidylserine/phosphatidylglycerophosphate/cardiolipin synthase family protein [Prevotella sp.]